MHPDLLLMAAIGQAYGVSDGAQNLYSLAHYGMERTPLMSVADVQSGLSLIGIDTYRIVAPGLSVPLLIDQSIAQGHIVTAQIRSQLQRPVERWIILCRVSPGGWYGLAVNKDWRRLVVTSHGEYSLCGHYLVCVAPLPRWESPLITS
jgi:hypothetical protein